MVRFIGLPQIGDGVSSLMDFAPLAAGIQNYNQGKEMAQQQSNMTQLGTTYANQGAGAAGKQALSLGEVDAGLQFNRQAQADKDRQIKLLGGVAQAAKFEKDPQRRALLWQTGLKRAGVNPADMDPEELDPMTGPDVFLAAAGMAQDPRESQLMDLKLAQANRDLSKPVSGDLPAIVQTYQFRQSLPENQRAEFDRVQRAQQWQDTGTEYINPRTGQVIPKNLADAEAQKEIGTALGKQAAAAPSDLSSADAALDLVDSIRNDPNRSAGTSTLSPVGNLIPKTPGYAFQNKVDQAKSGAFLTAIQQLRGMGALSNAEGQTATQAVTRMNTATDDKAFEEALQDYEKTILRGRRSAEKIMTERNRLMGGQGSAQPKGGGLSAGEYVYNPATGKVEPK